jgi:hypothetical protein
MAALSAGGTTAGAVTAEITVNPSAEVSVTGGDDVKQLKHLAAGVGWEFSPDEATTAGLKAVDIRRIRCINVDVLPGSFDKEGRFQIDDSKESRLDKHLKTCGEIGAHPVIIIGLSLHEELRMKAADYTGEKKRVMGMLSNRVVGPNDFEKYKNYYVAFFEYVLVEKGFKNAVFEAFNEPDIGGGIYPDPEKPSMGSAKLYSATLDMYRYLAAAANEFEQKHPGVKVRLGGPGLAWAYTFKFGAFNWANQFIKDCAREKLRLDFIGVHFYGNTTSLHGEYKSVYPSFVEMINSLKETRDRYLPGLPIYVNEWGPSYHVDNTEKSMVNANNIGAAWSAEFLNTMLENGVDSAIFLVTTDYMYMENGKPKNIWGWCSFFVNPLVYGGLFPKAPYHIFDMVARLNGRRIESTRDENIRSFAVADSESGKVQLMVWNYAARLPESGMPVDFATTENVGVTVRNASKFFGADKVKVSRRLVSRTHANAYHVYKSGGELTEDNTAMQILDSGEHAIVDGSVSVGLTMPPSSVSFIEIEPVR